MSFRRDYDVGGVAVRVRVEHVGAARYRVHVGERVLELEAWPVAGAVRVECEGTSHAVAAVRVGKSVHVRLGGRTWVLPLHQGRSAAGAAGGGRIEAPMTGTVLRVDVAAGDAVTRGDTVAVVSAMKMEHNLRADVDGRVAEVAAAAGQTVEQGALLVRIEPAAGPTLP